MRSSACGHRSRWRRPVVPRLLPGLRRGGHRLLAVEAVRPPHDAREVTIHAGRSRSRRSQASTRPGGLVLFAHGSGSSRHSPRNVEVARRLQADGLGTLLFDLLTERRGAATGANVFDIPLLAERLVAATALGEAQADLRTLPLGYFGASTGAAAALLAAAELPAAVAAVVSRGGRPDLAGAAPGRVTRADAADRGRRDTEVLELNRARARRGCAALPARRRPGRDAPVRGARRAGAGRRTGRRLVRQPPGSARRAAGGQRPERR